MSRLSTRKGTREKEGGICSCRQGPLRALGELAGLGALLYLVMASMSLFVTDKNKELNMHAAKASPPSPAPVRLEIYNASDCQGENVRTVYAHPNKPPFQVSFRPEMPKSVKVVGQGELKLFDNDDKYVASVVELEHCVKIHPSPHFVRGELIQGAPSYRIDASLQRKLSTVSDLSKPHTRIIFSCESAEYFGYQATTNAYAFLQSHQTDASWLRLLTGQIRDDLPLPTFQAPRTLYSKLYVPINKPDIIEKWFHSPDAPHPDDTIVVIDPDNWLLKDLSPWTTKVSRKKAFGQAAYYNGNKKVQTLWKEVCKDGCNNKVDTVGVPYVLKASDLQEVAPLWREYTLLLNEKRQNEKERFDKEFKTLYIDWTSEMYGWNFACAHLGIKTEVVFDLQVRDVDFAKRMSKQDLDKKAMIHMGRAWFPEEHAALAEKWRNTGGSEFKSYGIQVWCKCNVTGSKIMPWPVPDGLDLVSYQTLKLLHKASEWMPIAKNETFRKQDNYHLSMP